VELGVSATLTQLGKRNLTRSGEPGADLLAPMWRDSASASALYRDQLTFGDPTLPAGAPVTVSLSYYLSSDLCGGGGGAVPPPHVTVCAMQPPDLFDPDAAAFAHPRAVVEIASSVTLPGGVDRWSSTRNASVPGVGGGVVPIALTGNTLTHTFMVANGATHDYALSLTGVVVYDGLDYVDPGGRALAGGVQTWFDLDYFDTLHLGAVEATDALGNALPGFAITNSFGWTLDTTPPVPEPATSGAMLIGLGALLRSLRRPGRRGHRRPLLAMTITMLACGAAGTAQAQVLAVEGYACAGECSQYGEQRSSGPALSQLASQASGSTSAAHSSTSADFGVLRLYSASSGGLATSQAVARFSDNLTVRPTVPALLGEFGVLEWRLALDGIGDLQVFTDDGYGSVNIDAFVPVATLDRRWTSLRWFNEIGGPVQFDGDPWPRTIEIRQGFVFGEPFEIGFQLSASTGAAGALAVADVRHTATWGGIDAVRVSGVALDVDDYTLQSASGTDYRGALTPVPELSPALALAIGLAALALRRRRPRGRRPD
jgi:hypothetical protein